LECQSKGYSQISAFGGLAMRLSQLVGKEIINLSDGSRLGTISEAQLLVDTESGKIDSIVINRSRTYKVRSNNQELVIPWTCVRKVGEDLLIVELAGATSKQSGL
jgi:YlmC/YmxH family sporulation protein